MKNFKKEEQNYYSPSCFLIALEDDKLDEKNFLQSSDFFHEYIHYLQTMSLPFMQISFSKFATTLATLAQQAYLKGINNRPFSPITNYIQFVNYYLFQHYQNPKPLFINCSEFIDFKKASGDLIPGFFVNQFFIYFKNSEYGDNIIKSRISAFELIENMAANIEEIHFGRQNIPDLPYRVVNIIIQNKYSSLNLTIQQITKLIELSLYTLDPVDFLFSRLDYMVSLNRQINENEYEKIFFENLSFQGFTPDMNFSTLNDWLEYCKKSMCDNITNILGTVALKNDTYHFTNIINYMYDKRKNDCFLISKIMSQQKEEIQNIYYEYTLPLVYLPNEHVVSSENKDGNITLIPAILNTICLNLCNSKPEKKKCLLYDTCKQFEKEEGHKKYTDNFCITDPFNKDLKNIDCPFSLYARAKKLI